MGDSFVSDKTIFVYAGATFAFSVSGFAVMMISYTGKPPPSIINFVIKQTDYAEFLKILPVVTLEQELGFSAVSNLALAFQIAVGSAGLLLVLSILYAASVRVDYRKEIFLFFSFAVTTCAVLAVATGVLMLVSI